MTSSLLLAFALGGCASSKPPVPVEDPPEPEPEAVPAATTPDVEAEKPAAAMVSHTCTLANGASGDAGLKFTVKLQAPSDFAPQGEDSDTCSVGYGPPPKESADGVSVNVFVVHLKDGGAEKLLNEEPDGARQWAQKKSRGKAKDVGEGELEIHGSSVPFYQLHQFRFAPDHETLIARARVHDQNVVFMAFYPPSKKDSVVAVVRDIASKIEITPAP